VSANPGGGAMISGSPRPRRHARCGGSQRAIGSGAVPTVHGCRGPGPVCRPWSGSWSGSPWSVGSLADQGSHRPVDRSGRSPGVARRYERGDLPPAVQTRRRHPAHALVVDRPRQISDQPPQHLHQHRANRVQTQNNRPLFKRGNRPVLERCPQRRSRDDLPIALQRREEGPRVRRLIEAAARARMLGEDELFQDRAKRLEQLRQARPGQCRLFELPRDRVLM